MKICILSIVNIKHMSAASLYLDYFEESGIEYDIIYIDKYFKPEKIYAKNIYRFELEVKRDWSKLKKISKYITFRKYASKILKQNKYDLVITWGTETAFLFADYLLNNMKEKYIINIRDYANLNNKFKYFLLKKIVCNSKFTTISSNGFREFLPNNDYILIHSLNKSVLSNAKKRNNLKEKNEVIRICFIGYVRFYENDKRLIDSLGNDTRFIVQYFGVGSEVLEQYAIEKKIINVEFIKGFDVEDTAKLLDKADIINNLYGYNDIALDTAVSIKYYHSIFLRLPILVYSDTHMEKVTQKINFVFDDNYYNLGNRIYNWYNSIDFEEFKSECDLRLEIIEKENEIFYKKLKESINNNENKKK